MSRRDHRETRSGSAPEDYERYFVPAIGQPLADDLVAIAALRPGERVLDVACGTGVVARLAARRVGLAGKVAGLDVDPGMLTVARSKTPHGGAIDWHEGSAEAMPLPDSSFDAVLCQMGLQFVSDRHAALNEMRRVLVPGGRLILSVPGPTPPPFVVLAEELARHVDPGAAAFVHRVFSLHDPAELHELVEGAGFRDVSARAELESLRLPPPEEFLWQYVRSTPLAGIVRPSNDELRDALERDVVAGWQEFTDDLALTLHLRMVVATARK